MKTVVKPEKGPVLALIDQVGAMGYLLSHIEIDGVRFPICTVLMFQMVIGQKHNESYLVGFKCSTFGLEAIASVDNKSGKIFYVKGGLDFMVACGGVKCESENLLNIKGA